MISPLHSSWPIRRFAVLTRPLIVLALLAFNVAEGAGEPATAPKQPIWGLPVAPWPLPIVELRPGGPAATVSLLRAADAAGLAAFGEPHVTDGADALRLTLDARAASAECPFSPAVTISATPSADGVYEVAIPVGGSPDVTAVSLLVVAHPRPVTSFTYAPPAGETPQRVAVAGEFNGWNMNANLLERGDDGVFRAEVEVDPGLHKYKLVVDGDWRADPANPRQEAGGYGNSLLEVPGEKVPPLAISVLAASMPGMGPQGGLAVALEPGDALDPARTVVIVNNRRLDADEFALLEQGAIRLQVAPERWLAENQVTVAATSLDGRSGLLSVPFHLSSAPRSLRDEIIYFAFTDRFADGDPARNRPADVAEIWPTLNYQGGDWRGMADKIADGYFASLHATALWISPATRNTQTVEIGTGKVKGPMTSYHGYWPTDDRETNEQFGSGEDLAHLTETAHDKGMAVILDYVANHVHREHPLIREHPELATPSKTPDGRDNLELFDEFPYTTWFSPFLPSLDYDAHPELIERAADVARYWVSTYGIDGLRQDAVKHVTTPVWAHLTLDLRGSVEASEGRHVYQVGESIASRAIISEGLGPNLLDGQFDFPLYFTMIDVLGRGGGAMADLAAQLGYSQRDYPPGAIMANLVGNHDEARFLAIADGDGDVAPGPGTDAVRVDDPASYAKLQLAYAFMYAIPGPPTIYYGDELGMTGTDDPDNRRLMDWAALDGPHDIRPLLRGLGEARAGSVALRRGALEVLGAGPEWMAIARVAPEQTVVAVLLRRTSAEASDIEVALPAAWGTPRTLRSLVDPEVLGPRALSATQAGAALRIEAGAKAGEQFGYWEVAW